RQASSPKATSSLDEVCNSALAGYCPREELASHDEPVRAPPRLYLLIGQSTVRQCPDNGESNVYQVVKRLRAEFHFIDPHSDEAGQPIEPIVALSPASGSTSTIDPTLLNAALPVVEVGARTSELDSLRDRSVGSSVDDQAKSDGAPAGLSANDALRNVSVIDSADDGATPSPFEDLAASTAFPSHEEVVQDDGGMMSAGKEGQQGSSGGQSGVTESAGGQQSGLSPDDRPDNPLDGMFAADKAADKQVFLAAMNTPAIVVYEEGTGILYDGKSPSGGSDTPTYPAGSPAAEVLQAALDEQDGVSHSSRTEVTVLGDETITKTTSADGQITKWTFSADGSVIIVDRNNGTSTEMNADGSTRTTWEGKTLGTTPPLTGDKLDEDFEIPRKWRGCSRMTSPVSEPSNPITAAMTPIPSTPARAHRPAWTTLPSRSMTLRTATSAAIPMTPMDPSIPPAAPIPRQAATSIRTPMSPVRRRPAVQKRTFRAAAASRSDRARLRPRPKAMMLVNRSTP
ncbi:MAG: hypothetical protein AB1749_16340, partial [Pseudomonadota bacterium]